MAISTVQFLHTNSRIKEEVTEKLEEPEDHEVCGRSCNLKYKEATPMIPQEHCYLNGPEQ